MRRILLFSCILLVMICSLVGCGSSKKTSSKDNKTTKNNSTTTEKETTTDINTKPDEKKMAQDIDAKNGNVLIFVYNDSVTVTTKSVKIEKAKEENKSYIVTCTASQENEDYTSETGYELTYNFYDIGGWILDECITVSQKVTPIKEMPEELAYNLIMNETPYSSLTLVKSEPLNGNTCCYYYQGKNEYNYMDEIIDIKLTCTFDSKMGWNIQKETNTKQDWTKLCGEWYIQKYNSGYTYTYNVKVNSFDSTNNVADLDVHATTDSQYGFYGFSGIKEINEKVQGQIYAQTITENFQNTEYEVEMKFYGEDKNKTILELWTYWDRDTGLHLIYDPGFDAYFVPSKIS